MKNKRSLIIIGIALIMFVPLIVSAQTPLVPCGTSYAPTPCSLCHLFTLTQRILNFLAWIIAPTLAVLVVAISGFKILISGPAPGKRNEGINSIKIAITGLLIVFAAWVVINEVLLFFTNPPLDGAAKLNIADIPLPWHKIECVIPEVTITPPLPSRATESTATYRSDQGIRDELRGVGIALNKANCLSYGQTHCTSLDSLPENAVRGIEKFKANCEVYNKCIGGNCGFCNIVITGGTEAGHQTHSPGEPILDIRYDDRDQTNPNIINYIRSITQESMLTSKGPVYITPLGNFLLENYKPDNTHWHIEFK